MRAWIACSALAATLAAGPAAAQQARVSEGEAHIASAFTSRADPRVLAESVEVGPALREQLGGETDARKIYDALIERTSGKPLRVSLLTPGEAVRHASLPGVKAGEPLITLEAGELVLLFQYAPEQKNVTFVEQLSKPAARMEAQKPPPIVEVPLPTAPPPPAVVIEKPRPPAPAAAVAPVVKPGVPPGIERPRPRGECVIKPVMSEEDLWNCSDPVRPVAVERPALPVEAPKPAAARTETPAPRGECMIKPVMSEEDLRNCAAVSTPRTTAAIERPPVAVDKPQPSAPAIEAPKPRPECVIKPVMSEEDLRACGVRR